MISEPRFHRGSDADGAMHSAKVIVREMEAVRCPEVFPFLAEGVRQACETAHLHSDGEILTLNDGGADTLRGCCCEFELGNALECRLNSPQQLFRTERFFEICVPVREAAGSQSGHDLL